MKILFVCRGNVGRSQMAEAIFNNLAEDLSHTAISAGTHVVDKLGNSVDGELLKDRLGASNIIELMDEVRLDVRTNKRTQLTEEMCDNADLVVYMAEEENIPDYLIRSQKLLLWNFPDPKNADISQVRKTREDIADHVGALLKMIAVR